ncbi:MAG TPA: RraA family protein, partial [Candidatus Thermoplasmatota archaeon]|nr:RraA family protein [Candidatus Thermoplasmatota archaeon]
ARHVGSVDVFLEAMEGAPKGGLLVVDNGGRLDEACVGDLTAWAARGSGLVGMAVWGLHRDTLDLVRMGFPVWSLGALPSGPQRLDARPADALATARFGPHAVTTRDWVYADDDGLLFVAAADRERVEAKAREVAATERRQAERAERGTPLSKQLDLAGYLEARRKDPKLTFREHLRKRGGAIEE